MKHLRQLSDTRKREIAIIVIYFFVSMAIFNIFANIQEAKIRDYATKLVATQSQATTNTYKEVLIISQDIKQKLQDVEVVIQEVQQIQENAEATENTQPDRSDIFQYVIKGDKTIIREIIATMKPEEIKSILKTKLFEQQAEEVDKVESQDSTNEEVALDAEDQEKGEIKTAVLYDAPLNLMNFENSSGSVLTCSGGVNSYNGHIETWYSEKVLPGGGLNIPGRYTDEQGLVRDVDGYICVASSDYPLGTVIDTSLGIGKVYDTGCPSGVIDIYTNW